MNKIRMELFSFVFACIHWQYGVQRLRPARSLKPNIFLTSHLQCNGDRTRLACCGKLLIFIALCASIATSKPLFAASSNTTSITKVRFAHNCGCRARNGCKLESSAHTAQTWLSIFTACG